VLHNFPVDKGKGQQDKEHDPADGRAISIMVRGEGLPVLIQRHGQALVTDTSVISIENLRLGKEGQPAEGGRDDSEEDNWPQQWDGDAEEDVEGVGAIHTGGLVEVGWDALQASHVDQGVITYPAPDDEQGDRPLHGPEIAEPLHGWQVHTGQDSVDEAELLAK